MNANVEELVLFIVKSLVRHPDEAKLVFQENGDTVTLELRVAPDDMGRVIGKQGRIAKAIRTVLKSATAHEKTKYVLEIV